MMTKENKMVVDQKPKIHEKLIKKTSNLTMEFRKQTATAIMSAFGLIIALSWKDVITDLFSRIAFVKNYGLLISAVLLTVISVFGILIVSSWSKSNSEEKK